MKKLVGSALVLLLLAGCSSEPNKSANKQRMLDNGNQVSNSASNTSYPRTPYDEFIRESAARYSVDETLIRAIIEVESNFRPEVVSKSNAIGLMQIKASTAGRDAYRYQGKSGEPSSRDLKDPRKNIDIGTTYIRILKEQHLAGISHPQTLYYATVVAYVNGAGALLRTFDNDKSRAIAMINNLSPEEFYQHVQSKHPAPQAPRYLWKVKNAYNALQ
ncbi:Endo-type membrane-bound lytic murein transglycosylase A precursor [Providencia rustigianii]|uniref:peptidoglycan lytic exotransglycosylase n=2 Tax=Providencia rustigianii TaxID=158850 RepID=D1NYA3_9GAMM|nr:MULTISPECIES: transglycosylase SLT domain-containing protein [Providencia]EFB73951.1 transglycosylase SLT domain protein [Providencia rustigianii DSM 4541]MTC57198.1 transglycosylase SLT domain-containing protein [Providencia rustigianii]MTC60770.1 transglycosylase SLT domain-containing protein [Providencia rustigianii]SPY77314.1 Endo-type membrane-bound lytic murein transglycosylase A precursor [Providencia rustigianii]SUC35311.1 Endo-type membrane-bound lytic murein transglycosylase A pre